jgi:hypothetical protein
MYVCDMMYVLGFMKADNGDIEKKEIYNILYCWTFTCSETLSIYQNLIKVDSNIDLINYSLTPRFSSDP